MNLWTIMKKTDKEAKFFVKAADLKFLENQDFVLSAEKFLHQFAAQNAVTQEHQKILKADAQNVDML